MSVTTLQDLQNLIITAERARGWYPVPEDCAKSIIIESAELLELFQFDSTDFRNQKTALKGKDMEKIADETADVFWYLLSFCSKIGINLADALINKLKKVDEKYPIDVFKGKHNQEEYMKRKLKYRADKEKGL